MRKCRYCISRMVKESRKIIISIRCRSWDKRVPFPVLYPSWKNMKNLYILKSRTFPIAHRFWSPLRNFAESSRDQHQQVACKGQHFHSSFPSSCPYHKSLKDWIGKILATTLQIKTLQVTSEREEVREKGRYDINGEISSDWRRNSSRVRGSLGAAMLCGPPIARIAANVWKNPCCS